MYSGYKVNNSISKSNVSGLNETQIESLQKDVDVYTRKLEVEKRKYFAIQDQHKTVMQEYTKQKQQLNKLKKQSTKAESIILQAKVKNLQSTLDKAISSYDDTVAYNNKLKTQIDMLRREKKNYIEMQRLLQQQLKKVDEQTSQKMQLLSSKKKKVDQLREEINQVKLKNEQQREVYLNKFANLQKQYLNGGSSDMYQGSRMKNNTELLLMSSNSKPQIIDTQPLLKFRLKRIMASNKQKLRLIEQYKRHMMQIEEAFNQIKEKSNISDLEEITTTFIKSQQQNYSLYKYMDSLTQSIDKMEEENRELEEKIRKKMAEDQMKRQELGLVRRESSNGSSGNGKDGKVESGAGESKDDGEISENKLVELVNKIRPALQQILIQLADSTVANPPQSQHTTTSKKSQQLKLSLNITDRNIQEYLSELEKHIHLLQVAKQQAQTKTITQLKDGVTVYTKPIPTVNYQQVLKDNKEVAKVQQKDETKFWDQSKFRQYAIQFWQKRKGGNIKGINQIGTNQQLGVNNNTQGQQQQSANNQNNNNKQQNISSIVNL